MPTLEIFTNLGSNFASDFRDMEKFTRTISEKRYGIFKQNKDFNFHQLTESVINIIQNKYSEQDEEPIIWPVFFRENSIKEIKFATSSYDGTMYIDFVFNSEDDMAMFILAH